ncbi:hypothetical protein D3C73_1061630 [compost metagenome]
MHDDVFCAAFGQRRGADQRTVRAVEAQAHLGGDRNMRRHRTTDMLDNLVEQLGLLEQHRPAPGLVDGLGRAAEVQVDDFRAQLTGQCCVFRQAHRVRPQQLHTQRHASGGTRTGQQLRAELVEIGRGKQLVVDPDELGHAPVDTADAGQHVTQDVVDQPLHGCQGNLHGKHTRGKTCGSLLDYIQKLHLSPVGASMLAMEDQTTRAA